MKLVQETSDALADDPGLAHTESVIRPARNDGSLGLRPPRVLVVGDEDGQVQAALDQAAPAVSRHSVETIFDAIAQLQEEEFGAVLVNVEPLEHRPEPAVRAIREQLQGAPGRPPRLVLFGRASHEPLARQALSHGGDDYVLLPAQSEDVRNALLPRRAMEPDGLEVASLPLLPEDIPLASIVLDGLMAHAGASLQWAIAKINTYLPTAVLLELVDAELPGADCVSVALESLAEPNQPKYLVLQVPGAADDADRDLAKHDLQQLARELCKLAELDERHMQLQRLALTDDLTGCCNRRYFRHFLEKILHKAREQRFPVTLLLFDIDDFKHYNDRHGHRVGDAILRQTAELIKRCVRDHDLVARIGGDEFAVIFWEKDAPRVPHDPATVAGGRFPRGPLQIADRFRRLMADPAFFALGSTGQGSLTISGGMAVFPFDAQTADELIDAADRALIFGAKRSGKNSISLVGEDPTNGEHEELGDQG